MLTEAGRVLLEGAYGIERAITPPERWPVSGRAA